MEKGTYEQGMWFGWFVHGVCEGGNDDKEYSVNPYQADHNTVDPD